MTNEYEDWNKKTTNEKLEDIMTGIEDIKDMMKDLDLRMDNISCDVDDLTKQIKKFKRSASS